MIKKINWQVLSACMGIAILFWLLNALGMEYENIEVSYPITIEFSKKINRKIDKAKLPKDIKFLVSNNGWDILKFNISSKKPIKFLVYRQSQLYISRNEIRRAIRENVKTLKVNKIITKSIKVY